MSDSSNLTCTANKVISANTRLTDRYEVYHVYRGLSRSRIRHLSIAYTATPMPHTHTQGRNTLPSRTSHDSPLRKDLSSNKPGYFATLGEIESHTLFIRRSGCELPRAHIYQLPDSRGSLSSLMESLRSSAAHPSLRSHHCRDPSLSAEARPDEPSAAWPRCTRP